MAENWQKESLEKIVVANKEGHVKVREFESWVLRKMLKVKWSGTVGIITI